MRERIYSMSVSKKPSCSHTLKKNMIELLSVAKQRREKEGNQRGKVVRKLAHRGRAIQHLLREGRERE